MSIESSEVFVPPMIVRNRNILVVTHSMGYGIPQLGVKDAILIAL